MAATVVAESEPEDAAAAAEPEEKAPASPVDGLEDLELIASAAALLIVTA